MAVLTPLFQKFIDYDYDLVRKAGLVPIVWEELLLIWNIALGQNVIVQTWLSDASLSEVTARVHEAFLEMTRTRLMKKSPCEYFANH